MQITPTNEEFDILNSIIPFIPYNQDFEVYALIVQNIIKPKFPNGKGGIDLSKSDPAREDYRNRGIFKNIDTYLLENYFTEKVSEHNGNNVLRLTQRGEVLVAYGNMYAFFDATQPSTEKEIISRLPYTIAQAFPYGEFIIEVSPPKIQFININIFTSDESGELGKIQRALDPKEQLKKLYIQSVQDEEVLQYLVQHGFAINRHDIKIEGKIYRQLTDKGRELKECGTIEAYNAKIASLREAAEADKRLHREITRRQAHLAEEQLVLSEKQAGLSKRQYYTNIWLAVASSTVGIVGVFQLFDYYEKHSWSWQRFSYFLTGFGIALLLWLVSMLLQKTKSKA